MTEVNSKGREILIGPRGGKYVIGPGGRKIPVKTIESKAIRANKSTSPMIETGKINAKKRTVYKDSKGRTYVKPGDKKVYVKKIFTPEILVARKVANPVVTEKNKATSPMIETGKINAKKRTVYKDSKGRTYVKPGNKKVYVKKLFTPKTEIKRKPDSPHTNKNAVVRKVAKIWKQKVNNRLKPLKKGRNYDPNVFEMVAPRINIQPRESGAFKKVYSNFIFPIQTAKGKRIDSRAVIATRKDNIRHVDYLADQTDYLKNMNIYDLMTVAAYTHYSHWWLGPYQRSGRILVQFSKFRQDMIFPLFPQMESIIDAGYDVLKTNKVAEFKPYITAFTESKTIVDKYFIYISLAQENVFSNEALKLALQMYVNDFTRIINDSPPVTEPLVVYRGISTDVLKEKKGSIFKSKQFTSTAYNVEQAVKYSTGNPPHLQRITISRGKHALFIAPVNKFGDYGEYEVVLPPCDFQVTGRNRKMRVLDNKRFKFYRVTDLKML
ncbi:PBCV-specific basic adaptor domain-containing protein [Paramecium bursaria Chlorella virus NYs1]|uniref:PBCV-specific basic adaptor domain-containing protein n=1 Tax=Paramecium bursaria Chlorella virus NYs1 TaxID=83442 RepID=M1I8M1_9PHYC|nr:PBCV-specific basic adaptor domain-containing protein [Paramecium bursaria Chlorella virus NYs1]AGE54944.1 PBCV-specific basic adaptor domain-containing protein [Paramecium bursaria Chlorella virus MA1D]AGE58611.1 PBCV-specific basic adaptor domain-containing protein [Paramecium bursaria Chlorella virus NYs1]